MVEESLGTAPRMHATIDKISIEWFKSIRRLDDFELRDINVLIGPNGSGKSNFVSFFKFLRDLIEQQLQIHIGREGGADAALFLGRRETKEVLAKLYFGKSGFEFSLIPTVDNQLVFQKEMTFYLGPYKQQFRQLLGSGHLEAKLKDHKDDPGKSGGLAPAHYIYRSISNWVVYHFHDTGATSGVRGHRPINDNAFLRPDGENLAAFLFRIRKTAPVSYGRIRDVIRLAAPFFDDFKLRPVPTNEEYIALEWTQNGSDYPFRASQLSDGTLRFMCLATTLLQPLRPATVLFDEPELGLHPYALTLLGNLFQHQEAGKQIIVSTQSALLLNEFAPEDIIVVDRQNGESTFNRLNAEALSEWLSEYSLGELWLKNVLGGRPHQEAARMAESPS